VANVAPSLSNVEVTAEIEENGEVKLKGALGDASPLDSFTLTVDWGDGQSETHHFAAGTTEFEFTHQYLDDNPSGTPSDEYTIYLKLSDDDLGVTEEKVTTIVKNVAPALSDVTVTPSIDEGGEVHLTGSIADVGTLDSFILRVDWGDGAVVDFPFPAGTTTFDVTHSYVDDSSAVDDSYPINVTLIDDDQGEDVALISTSVANVAPTLADVAITSVDENGVVHLTGEFSDPGVLDTFTLTVNWGEGDPEVFVFPAGTTSFDVTHQYLDDNPSGTSSDLYTVQLTLADDDGGEDAAEAATTITNVAPVAAIDGAPTDVEPGVQIDLTGLVTDVGTQDTHTLTWEVLRNGEFFASGDGAVFSFTPTEVGSYQVTLTVVDDDLGEDTDTVTIEVTGEPPAAPAVSQVLVSSTEWQQAFFDLLGGAGYAIPAGGDQWAVLPWSNLNQIRLVFTEDVSVAAVSLSIAGENVSSYGVAAFAYDPLTFTATWTLADTFDVELVSLTLSDSVVDVNDGLALNGEWANGASAFPSGDATAGGAFQFSFRVLPGDADRNGEVGITDLNIVRNTFGDATSNVFHDLSGNGSIDIGDLNAVRNFFGEFAVSIPPPPIAAAPSGNAADLLFTLVNEADGDSWWNEDDATDGAIARAADAEPWEWAFDDDDRGA